MATVLIYFSTYLIPAFVMTHEGLVVFFRNPRKIEHRLFSLILGVISLMFFEEFVRQLSPESYSPVLVAYVFGNLGALSSALIMHFYMHITSVAKKLPRALYLPFCYLPLAPVILTLVLRRNVFNSEHFYRVGLWIQPVYDTTFYISIWIGIFIISLMAIVALMAIKKAATYQARWQMRSLFFATLFYASWTVVTGGLVGRITIFTHLPPYPYLYGLVAWLLVLRWAMFRYNFLPSHELKYKALFNLAPAAILIVDDMGGIIEANSQARRLFGLADFTFLDLVASNRKSFLKGWLAERFEAKSRIEDEEMYFERSDGTTIAGIVDAEFMEIDEQRRLLVIVRDMTDRIFAEQEHRQLAYYDSLTLLPNRNQFARRLNETIHGAKIAGRTFGVLLLDLDGFKQINDTYGHLVGDAVIHHVGQVLQSAIPKGDFAARLAGDEFVAIIHGAKNLGYMHHVANELTRALSESYEVEGHHMNLSGSIGFSLYPKDGQTQHELIKRADQAMYLTKRKTNR